ncbi:MAG: insulinase family protein [Pseudomonadota bacterium]
MQFIVLSGAYDDPEPSGTAHLTEHLAAFSADTTVIKRARERDVNASLYNVSTVYTNSGAPSELETLLRLSRALLDKPKLPPGFAESEIDIIERETLLRERNSPYLWLSRIALQNLYGTLRGRADNMIEDLPKLNLEKAYQFHQDHYVPSNVTLIVSGQVSAKKAADLVAEIFGDTEHSEVPDKPWLEIKPDPTLRSVEKVASDRLSHDAVQYVKFVDFTDAQSSVDTQGVFFIATNILGERLSRILYFEDPRFLMLYSDWFFAKNGDLELSISMELMPGFSLESAHRVLEETIANLLSEPISGKEIREARRKEIVYAQSIKYKPSDFLYFLKNVASDGFRPISPSTFVEILNNTTDQEVLDFAERIVEPSATSVVLAESID